MPNYTLDQVAQALQKADAAGDTQGAQQLAQAYKQMQAQGQGGQTGQAVPTAAPVAPRPQPTAADLEALRQKYSPLNDMGFGEKMLVGAGQGFNEMGQGAKQLYSMLTNNPQMAQQVADTRAENKRADDALSGTLPGKLGNIGANIAVAAIPVGGLEAAGSRLAASGAKSMLTKALINRGVQGAIVGGAQGALQPTDGDGSHAMNAVEGGALGAAAPYVIPVAAKVVNKAFHPASTVQAAISALRGGNTAANAALSDASRQQIGEQMGKIMSPSTMIPISPNNAAKMARIKGSYLNSLDQDTKNAMDQYILAGSNKGQVPADLVQEARSGAIKNFNDSQGAVSNGYSAMQRELDSATDAHLSTLPKGKAQVNQLKLLRNAYGKTAKGVPVDLSTIPGTDAYKRAMLLRNISAATGIGVEQQVTQP